MDYSNRKIPIRQWSEADKPREKMILRGRKSLSDAELLAILIGSGTKENSAIDLSVMLLHQANNNLEELSKMNLAAIRKIKGLGLARAVTILAALELGRRHRSSLALEKTQIVCSNDVFEIMQSAMADLEWEEFWILLLNRANKVITKICVSEGGLAGTVADPKKIFRLAMEHLSSSIILCHNHPSGNLTPSETDKALTKKLSDGGKFLDIQILDHIIICGNRYFSFADDGLM